MQSTTPTTPTLRFPEFSGEWENMKLDKLCDYRNGGSYESHIVKKGKYNLITLNSIDIDGKIKNVHKQINEANWFLRQGDLIMVLSDVAHGNFLGLVDVISESDKYVLNQRMGLLRKTSDDVNLSFLRKFINNNQLYFKKHGQGSSQQNLSKRDILKFVVKLPKLSEQQKIADFLGSVDGWIENLEKQRESLETYKRGLMQRIFSQEIRFRDEDGGDFPEWEERRLGEVGMITTGRTPATVNSKYYGGNIPWITPTDMVGSQKNIIISKKMLTKIGVKAAKFVPRDSLLVTCIASIGKNVILRVDGSCNQQINAITPNHGNSVDFLYYLLSQNKNKLVKFAGSGTMLILNKRDFSKIKMFIPSLPEQQEIVDFLTSVDEIIESKQKQVASAKKWKQGLMQRMFV